MCVLFPGVFRVTIRNESRIICLYQSPYPTSDTICFGDFRPSNSLREPWLCNAPAHNIHLALRMMAKGGSMCGKTWLIFLDQIKKMMPLSLVIVQTSRVPPPPDETRRQSARSASLNIDAERREHKSHIRMCFFKFKVLSYWKHHGVL